jgi:predicted DNA-binding transcriptional regulator AlpA
MSSLSSSVGPVVQFPVYTQPSQIKQITGLLGRTKALELEASDPSFPKRIKLFAGRTTAWRTQELFDWIESQSECSS